MASIEDLRNVIRAESAPKGFSLEGGDAVYLDFGTSRRWLTEAQQTNLAARYTKLPATDPFWQVPLLGTPGEVYKQAGDNTGRCWAIEEGRRRHVDAAEYASWRKPIIKTLPVGHVLWSLPIKV